MFAKFVIHQTKITFWPCKMYMGVNIWSVCFTWWWCWVWCCSKQTLISCWSTFGWTLSSWRRTWEFLGHQRLAWWRTSNRSSRNTKTHVVCRYTHHSEYLSLVFSLRCLACKQWMQLMCCNSVCHFKIVKSQQFWYYCLHHVSKTAIFTALYRSNFEL